MTYLPNINEIEATAKIRNKNEFIYFNILNKEKFEYITCIRINICGDIIAILEVYLNYLTNNENY